MKNLLKLSAAAVVAMGTFIGAAMADVTLKVAYENNPGEPIDVVFKKWAKDLDEQSGGTIKLELYPSSQLGSHQDVTEQALFGSNIVTISDVGFLADFIPDLSILFGPYLSDDPDKLFAVYESDWFKEKEKELAEKGIHVVMKNYLYGVRHLIANKPVNTPDDLQGMKIRTPNNDMQIKAIAAMGGTPTPMPLGEAYTALTQGIVDGVENPLPVIDGAKFQEAAKYLSMIGYLTNTSLIIGGEAFFKTLDPKDVALIEKTAFDAGIYSQELAAKNDAELLEKFKKQGVEVIYPDTAPFREKSKAVYSQFPEWSDGLYEKIQEQLK